MNGFGLDWPGVLQKQINILLALCLLSLNPDPIMHRDLLSRCPNAPLATMVSKLLLMVFTNISQTGNTFLTYLNVYNIDLLSCYALVLLDHHERGRFLPSTYAQTAFKILYVKFPNIYFYLHLNFSPCISNVCLFKHKVHANLDRTHQIF